MTTETEGAPEGVTEPVVEQTQDQTDAQVQEGDTGDDAAAAAEGEGESSKPRKSAQDRIDEVTRARREAERDRDYWRDLAMQNQRRPEPQAQPQPQGDAEPDPAQYEYGESDARFIRDLARFEARQEFRKQAEEDAAARQAQEIERGFAERQAAAASKYEDYHEVVIEGANRNAWVCTPVMADVIKTGEGGPDVAYHLAKNPAEARRIAALPPIAQVRELTKLEVRLTAAPPPPKTATDAPDPPPQARGAGGKFKVSADTDDFAAFDKQYGGS